MTAMKLNPHRLPKAMVMDLIAISRLLYAKEQAGEGHPIKLQQIEDVGRSLKVALDLAAKCEPGTMGMKTAWERTEEALATLGDLLREEMALPLLQTVGARLLKIRRG